MQKGSRKMATRQRSNGGRLLADYLNYRDVPPPPKQHAVLSILHLCRDLRTEVAKMHFEVPSKSSDVAYCDLNRNPRTKSLAHRLRTELAPHTSAPSLGIPYKRAGILHLDVGHGVGRMVPFVQHQGGTIIDDDYAIELLLKLADDGSLDLVKQCKCECQTWFLASRADQEYLSLSHRQKAHKSSTAFKAKWSSYMRARYWTDRITDLEFELGALPRGRRNAEARETLTAKLDKAKSKLKQTQQAMKNNGESTGKRKTV
jgi:hypothetical protein